MGDISQAVHYSSLDLGTLVANGIIEKWALHKPVRLKSNVDTPNDISSYSTWVSYMQNNVALSDGTGSAPFGLSVNSSYDIYDVIGTNSAPTINWEYEQPPTTGNFHRRMLDFDGYTTEPNVPINSPETFTYYTAQGVTNVLELDTNDGEAGNTSIPISVLNTLNNYQLMLAIKENASNNWYYTVMSGSIMNSVDPDTHKISFTLPSSLSITPSSQGHQAYLVGVTASANIISGQWVTTGDSNMQSFYSMIPLPFSQKSDCNFLFKVAQDPDTNIVHYDYVIYMNHSYVVKYIEFNVWIYRNVSPPTSFSVNFNTIVAHPDYDDSANFPFTNEVLLFGNGTNAQSFTYNSSTHMSYATIKRDVSRFNYTLDDHPNLTFEKSNSENYGWDDGGNSFQIKWVD